jgi:hypothetical protein
MFAMLGEFSHSQTLRNGWRTQSTGNKLNNKLIFSINWDTYY